MNVLVKVTIVLLCLSFCGAGTFIASTVRKENQPRKTNVIPVKNRELGQRIWIVT